jgi:hypothetical protein
MSKVLSINKEENEYNQKYGKFPSEKNEILEYIENNFKLNYDKIKSEEERIKNIPWKELYILLPLVPKPSPRPRYSFETKHFYVKGAAKNKKIIKDYITGCNIIYTRTDLNLIIYQPTPVSSMTNNEIYLAEKGVLQPIQNPD